MPFLQLEINHIAQSHLSRPIALSSKIVPTLTENCFLQSRHFHISRVVKKDSRFDAQRGHAGPSAHRSFAMKFTQVRGSEKCLMTSTKVCGTVTVAAILVSSMYLLYDKELGESSDFLPFVCPFPGRTVRSRTSGRGAAATWRSPCRPRGPFRRGRLVDGFQCRTRTGRCTRRGYRWRRGRFG